MHERHQTEPRPPLVLEALDYQLLIERLDERTLGTAYIGRWPDREAFGQSLLEDTSAAQRLSDLPRWLRPYVRLDGAALVADLERDGVFLVADIRRGICVFDRAAVGIKK